MPDSTSSLSEWLAWLETLHPREIDLGLDRVAAVAWRLGLSDELSRSSMRAAKVITVAGTNGKGSCIAAMETLLLDSGKRVGTYTSPHLIRFNERCKINGEEVADEVFCSAFDTINRVRQSTSLTYFEFATLAALLIFKYHGLDYWLLEVGLGGRLDAVNCVDPDIAVITSIDLDHQQWLGNTREAIGGEKAGILREGIPFVCLDEAPPSSLVDAAKALSVQLFQINQHFGLVPRGDQWQLFFHCDQGDRTLVDFIAPNTSPLPINSVLGACQVLRLLDLDLPENLTTLTLNMVLPGRFSKVVLKHKHFYLDVAHNPAAARMLADRLAYREFAGLDACVAIMADKDVRATLLPLLPHVAHWHCIALPNNARALPVSEMQKFLQELGVEQKSVISHENMQTAIKLLMKQRDTSEVLVFGSFFTVESAIRELAALASTTEMLG